MNTIVEGWNPPQIFTSLGISIKRRDYRPKYLSAKERATRRDNSRCILTKMGMFEVAHIVPYNFICQDLQTLKQAGFWNALAMFFSKEKLDLWKAAVITNRGPTRETPSNLLCLNPLASALWNAGAFALKPISISSDRRALTIQFFWQTEYKEDASDVVSLSTLPPSARGLDGAYNSWLLNDSGQRIKSGDRFVLNTKPSNFVT
ncbi:hypothetical protein F5884DRAFT_780217 [Xylogone sp. PMI_703]|nr:hypothetical protein F5884DRAFT_780217 [Xylogone sp. PMI_703]